MPTSPTVTIRVELDLLGKLDAQAAAEKITRSAWITNVVRESVNRTEVIRFRCTPDDRERYEAAAGEPGKLSSWLRGLADAASEVSEREGTAPAGLADSMPPDSEHQVVAEQDAARKAGPAPASNLREQRAAAYREKMGR